MAAAWPSTLSKCIESSSFSESEDPQYIATDIDNGPRKTRRVINRGFLKINASVIVDKDQYITFMSWWNREVAGGAGAFNFTHPISKELKSFKFANPYKIAQVGPRNWRVSMEWAEVGLTDTVQAATTEGRTMYYTDLNSFNSTTIALSSGQENFQVYTITPTADLTMADNPFTGTTPPSGTEVLIINTGGSGHVMNFNSSGTFSLNGDCMLYPGRSLTVVRTTSGYYEKGRA